MHLYFAGAEVASHMGVLKECGVSRLAVSAHNLSRVAKGEDLVNWANRARLAGLDWVLYADSDHTPVSVVTQVLSGADIQPEAVAGPIEWYTNTWIQDSDLLFLPFWDGHDPGQLREFMEDFDGVIIPDSVVDNPTSVRSARAALPRMGTLAALTGRSKALDRFDILCSSAWWAVQKYGETQVWTGDRLVRLNSDDKELKRSRYTNEMAALGVDVDAVMADDPTETIKLAVKSWVRLEQHLAAGRRVLSEAAAEAGVVTNQVPANVVPLPTQVAIPPSRGRHEVLPVVGVTQTQVTVKDANGQDVVETSSAISVIAESLRQCNTCSLSVACPSYQPAAPCSYQIPVTIRNHADLSNTMRALVEIQTQRILMGRFEEEIRGEADERVGREMDRLFKMVKRWRDIEDNRDSLRITVDSRGDTQASMGVLSRLFGEKAGRNATMLDEPIDSDEIIDPDD